MPITAVSESSHRMRANHAAEALATGREDDLDEEIVARFIADTNAHRHATGLPALAVGSLHTPEMLENWKRQAAVLRSFYHRLLDAERHADAVDALGFVM